MFLRSVAIASALMLSLAGCSGDDSSTTEDSASTTNSTQTTQTTQTTNAGTDTDTDTDTSTAGTDSDAMTTTEATDSTTTTTTTDGTETDATTAETDSTTTTTTTTDGTATDTTTDGTTGDVEPDCMGEPYCTPGPMGDQCLTEEFGEIPAALMGFDGLVCSPGPCGCPMDDAACQKKVDDGDIEIAECPKVDGVSAVAQCALTVSNGMGPGSYSSLHCLLICQLANGNDDCPTGATCEDAMQMGLGICLFPEG